jgi:probable HAF family extracellular repeat protein
MRIRRTTIALLLLLFIAIGDLRAQSSSTPLYLELPENVLPFAIGANGWVAVGDRYDRLSGTFWMPTTGSTDIGGTFAGSVSRDGKTIVGNAFDSQGRENAAIWAGGRAWRVLGSFTPDAKPCDVSYSSTYGVSADATVIVGLAWDGCAFAHAFRWTEQTGMVDLGSLNGKPTRANAVSGDGHVIVGWGTAADGPRNGTKWVDGVQQMIKATSGGPVGEAFGVNSNGSIIVGSNCDFNNQPTPVPTGFVWTPDKGVQCLPVDRPRGLAPLPYHVLVNATSDDGRVMVGSYTFGLDAESLIWLDGQVYFLKDYLRNNGVPTAFNGWINTGFVTAVTPDGRTIVGYGAGPKTFQGYMVVLPDRGNR